MSYIYTRADHLASQGTGFEPQRMHNWSVVFELPSGQPDGSIDGGGPALQTVQLSLVQGFLPNTFNEVVPIQYGNEEVYIAGKASSEEGRLICRDFVDQPTAAILLNWRRRVYNPQTGAINLARNYKTQASIILEAPNVNDLASAFGPAAVGNTITDGGVDVSSWYGDNTYTRVWKLQGCWPVAVMPAAQGLDMGTSQTVMISVTIRFDKAIPEFAYSGNVNPNISILPIS